MHSYKHKHMLHIWQRIMSAHERKAALNIGVCSKPLNRFQWWRGSVMHVLTTDIGMVGRVGNRYGRVGKRILSNRCLPTLAWNPAVVPGINKLWVKTIAWQLVTKTRMLCYRKDVRAMHNPTIRTWFAARKSICTIYYRSLGCTGKNKAKRHFFPPHL